MAEENDGELIRATLAGDRRAFTLLVERHQRRVAAAIRSVMGSLSQQDLADVAQDIFLLAYRGLGSFRGDALFSTWITRIALRHCYREAKRRSRRRGLFTSLDEPRGADATPLTERIAGGSRTDRPLLADERRRAVVAALDDLPEEFRTVLVLRIVEEMPVEEVAAALGVSPGTVKSRLHRAREKMRELLDDPELAASLDDPHDR